MAAARISIEDGAFFKGGIDIRKPDAKPAQGQASSAVAAVVAPIAGPAAHDTPKPALQ